MKSDRLLLGLGAVLALVGSACSSNEQDLAQAQAEVAALEAEVEALEAEVEAFRGESAGALTATERLGHKVGYISPGDHIPFVKLVSASIRTEADRLGVNLLFCDTAGDPEQALRCAQSFAVREIQGLLTFQPFQEISPELCAVLPAGIPVIAVDTAQPPCQLSFVGANSRYAGYLGGIALGEYFKDNFDCDYTAYISLESSVPVDATRDRMDGYRDGFKESCRIVNEQVLEGADRTDSALQQLSELLPELPGDRIAVVAPNEESIIGAITAARELGREGDLYYSGQGTDPSIWCHVRNDPNYIASVAYYPERYGTIAIPAIIDAIHGRTIASHLFTPHRTINSENIGEFYDVTNCG